MSGSPDVRLRRLRAAASALRPRYRRFRAARGAGAAGPSTDRARSWIAASLALSAGSSDPCRKMMFFGNESLGCASVPVHRSLGLPCPFLSRGIDRSGRDRQVLVNQRDDGGTFPDRAAHALHGARAHVADGEHARHARLERAGEALRRALGARLPVSTKPCASSVTPQPSSHSVSGSAPMNRKTLRIGRRSSLPVWPSRQVTASSASPGVAVEFRELVNGCSSMFGAAPMRSIR